MDWLRAFWFALAKDDSPSAGEVGAACLLVLALWLAPSYIAKIKVWERLLTLATGLGVAASYVKRCNELQDQESYDRAARLMQQELAQHQLATEAAFHKDQLSAQYFPTPEQQQPAPVAMPAGIPHQYSQQQPTAQPQYFDPLPAYRNLAIEIVHLDGHMAIVSKTRSGKTSLLVRAIEEAIALEHQVYILDGKGDRRLQAIKGVTYAQVNTPDKVVNGFNILEIILDELAHRQSDPGRKQQPITLFIDEYNLILDSCRDTQPTARKGEEVALLFARKTKRVVLQGAAEKMYLIASNHTSRVEDWLWNTGVLDSLSFMALGRNGAFESLEDLLKYQITGKRAKEFRAELDAYYKMTIAEPLVLTTLAPAGFFRLPFYGDATAAQPSESPPNQPESGANRAESAANRAESAANPIHSGSNPKEWLERCYRADCSDPNSLDSARFDSDESAQNGQNGGSGESNSPESEFTEIDGLDDRSLADLIVEFRQCGINGQNAFIKALWDISAGDSPRYRRARERYQEVCKRYDL